MDVEEFDEVELTVDRVDEDELRVRAWATAEPELERAALYLTLAGSEELARRLERAGHEPPREDPHWGKP